MGNNNKPHRDYYGLFIAEIDHDRKLVELTLKRYRDQVMDSAVDKLREWVVSRIEKKYPGYSILERT